MNRLVLVGPLLAALVLPSLVLAGDLDDLWDHGNPGASRERFQERLGQTAEAAERLELLTQIARTWGLQGDFSRSHAVLDSVIAIPHRGMPRVRIRYLLERGRTHRSGGDPERARPLFEDAFELARTAGEDALAVDAAHMVALVVAGAEIRDAWHAAALELAEASAEPRARAWRGSLYNNMGWDRHDAGRYEEALALFRRALAAREEQGDERRTRVARWCVGRALRSTGRIDEALAVQRALRDELDALGEPDGYVLEELGELHLARGEPELARESFARAWAELSRDSWMLRNEADRMARIRSLAGLD